jgi:hypothetical protein
MTTPQDPNQPAPPSQPGPSAPDPSAPGWGAPVSTPQPGWGAPPPPTQPGWGAPPPPQPGWGAPPPGYQQPGWGAPPPGYQQPGYQQPGWGQPGWGPPPNRSFASRHGCLLAFVIVLVLALVGVGGCVVLLAPTIGTDITLTRDLGPRASRVQFNIVNGRTFWTIELAPGYESQAKSLACGIIRADLNEGTSGGNTQFEVVDADGALLADESTPCS